MSFNTPITAIVGPNGSGKSNAAEAFRFVLGEQSLKSMRGKKGEDLIFNGSTNLAKMNRASVKLIFDNSKRFFTIDFDEVSIERVVHRDGVNEYFLNGTQVRLKDIIELLAAAHIGATGHHIISQGEADRVLNANIRERREMIEDALGLKIYQYKRQESEKKLEKTSENIEKVQSLRREIAPHLRFLKKQVEKIEKARELREELRLKARQYFKREEYVLELSKKHIEAEKQAPLEALKKLDVDLAAAREAIEQSKKALGHSAELLTLEGLIRKERDAREFANRDLGRIEGELAGARRTLKREEEMAAREEHRTVELREVEHLRASVEALAAEVDQAKDEQAFKSLYTKIKDLISTFIARHRSEQSKTDTAALHTEIAQLESEKARIEATLRAAQERERNAQGQYEALKSQIEKQKEGSLEAEKNILHIMTEQGIHNAKLSSIRANEDRVLADEQNFKRDIHEIGLLLGRDVLAYAQEVIVDESGNPITEHALADHVTAENRSVQIERRRVIEKLKIRLEEFGGGSGDDVLKEYRETEERDAFLAREIIDLEASAASLVTLIEELKQKLDEEFNRGITKINTEFQNFFALMFGGGNAQLKLVREERKKKRSLGALLGVSTDDSGDDGSDGDDEDRANSTEQEILPFGIDISVSLPNKRVQGLAMLSGGERALTSIALLFAMSQVNPPPFIILDETDAALDEANSRKYGDMIENLARFSQLILITHNRETMSRAGVLYGVTMGNEGASKLLSIQFEEAVKVAK